MIVVIDNYDSFTYNLVQYLGELGAEVRVVRNDVVTVANIEALRPERIVISPGPGTPRDAGISCEVIQHLGARIPILGVCLGHQCIGYAYGGRVDRARAPMHGKSSWIHHNGKGVFRDLPNPFEAIRYHSLVVLREHLPPELEVTAETQDQDKEIMGLKHNRLAVHGVQFHPESILTKNGKQILLNFLAL